MRIKQNISLDDRSETNCSDSSPDLNTTDLVQNDSKIHVHSLIKRAVSRKLFLGEYTEKRYVEMLNSYRDIIVIDHVEQEIIQSLRSIQKIVNDHYKNKKWLGITNDDNGFQCNYYLWTNLEKLTLGRYWFKIKSIHINDKEICFQLKAIRPFGSHERVASINVSSFDINEILNKENIWKLLSFGFVLFMTIITCIINFVPFFLNWILKFVHEVSYLVQSFTPLVLGIYDLVGRCIGGLYWMIIMMFRSPNQMTYPQSNVNRKRIMY